MDGCVDGETKMNISGQFSFLQSHIYKMQDDVEFEKTMEAQIQNMQKNNITMKLIFLSRI